MKKCFGFLFCFVLAGCMHRYPAQDLPYLKGRTASQVESSFGRPAVIHKEKNSTLWSYYQNDCSSLIFFDTQDIVQYAELRGRCATNVAKN